MRQIWRNTKAVSNVIVIVLSLVILTVVVANVVLWSYQMNQLDWERMQENISIAHVVPVSNSSWFPAEIEYAVNTGLHMSGTYIDTQAIDTSYERFNESQGDHQLDISGNFAVDTLTYPLSYIRTIEMELKFRASDASENWYIEAYNWTGTVYSNNGFNFTEGYTPSTGWDYYAVNFTSQWSSYMHDNGTVSLRFIDEEADNNQTTIDIDFLAIRVAIDGASFSLRNGGALTAHIVSLWVNNLTYHKRYTVDIFANAGETILYFRSDIRLPSVPYIVKVVSERGNIALHSES